MSRGNRLIRSLVAGAATAAAGLIIKSMVDAVTSPQAGAGPVPRG